MFGAISVDVIDGQVFCCAAACAGTIAVCGKRFFVYTLFISTLRSSVFAHVTYYDTIGGDLRQMTTSMGRGGYRWAKLRQLVYAVYGPVCHICLRSAWHPWRDANRAG